MQMLRYMIHIWEDYEKQMEKEHGLLKKGDEISLTMLINKIASPEDMEAFANLPDQQVNEILKDTPEYLLTIMERLARALFYNLSIPEDKTEEAVAKIKERKMARLFENVTFNYQAEIESMRNKTRQMEEDMERRIEEKKQQMEEDMERRIEEKKQQMEEDMERRIEEKKQELEEQSKSIQKEQEIFRQICKMSLRKCSDTEIEDFLIQNFCITREKAKEEIGKLYED